MDFQNYCDYCPDKDCPSCKDGEVGLSRAKTEENKWICDRCFYYGKCGMNADGEYTPCRGECIHRPKLISKWITRRI